MFLIEDSERDGFRDAVNYVTSKRSVWKEDEHGVIHNLARNEAVEQLLIGQGLTRFPIQCLDTLRRKNNAENHCHILGDLQEIGVRHEDGR